MSDRPARFVLGCFVRDDVDPEVDDADQTEEADVRGPLEERAEILARGGKFKLIVLWGGNREEAYDVIRQWPDT